jgi:glycine oxidase
MEPHSDVTVIGGGIIGLTSAYFLAKAGLKVTLIDRQDFGSEASWAGAGIIPPGNPARAVTPADKLRAESVSRFEGLSAELRELTGLDNGYVRCGGIEILDEEDADVVAMWRAEGLLFTPLGEPGPQGPWVADKPPTDLAVGVHQPPHTTAYLLPDFAQVRNPRHLRALIAACERVGVTLLPHTPFRPEQIRPDRRYLLASGAWVGEFLPSLPVRPVRGQIVLFRCDRPPFPHIVMHGKRYLVPRPDGRVLVGSTEEPEAGFEKANTPEGIEALKRFAFGLCPELRAAEVEKTWAGLRPGSADGLPYIGPVPGASNVFAAVGHFRAGVQLSIGTALMVRGLLTDELSGIPLHPFHLDRTPDRTTRPAFQS